MFSSAWRVACGLVCVLGVDARAESPASTPTQVRRIHVQPDRAPDCSSLRSIIDSVTRECRTNDQKAVALYNFLQLSFYHQGYPGEPNGVGALKAINVYGWSLCGGLHTIEAALWREIGWKWRYVGWSDPGHTTVEAQYDGRWHYLDVFLKFYTWMPNPKSPGGFTIAGQDDIYANPALVSKGLTFDKAREVYYQTGNRFRTVDGQANWRAPAFLSCGDQPADLLKGIRSRKPAGSPTGWGAIEFDSPGYSTDVNLAPGHALTLGWNAIPGAHWWSGRKYIPKHSCGDKDCRNCPAVGPVLEPYDQPRGAARTFANGRLVFQPDLRNALCLQGLQSVDNVEHRAGQLVPRDASRPASVIVALQSPYIMSRASGEASDLERAEVSLDHGKTFRTIELKDFSDAVGGRYDCLVKLTFQKPLTSLRLEAIVQCNRGALPYLSPGKNIVRVDVADAKALGDQSRLVITYAYQVGSRDRTYEELADSDAELARQHGAKWTQTPTCVQKVFKASDLPATFEIDIPTPENKQPVYPKMLFLRREVIGPDAQPTPLPEGAVAPVKATAKTLKTLPNPFTVGIMPPKAADAN